MVCSISVLPDGRSETGVSIAAISLPALSSTTDLSTISLLIGRVFSIEVRTNTDADAESTEGVVI